MALCVFMAAPSDAAESAKNRGACIDETAYAKKCAEIKDSSQKKTICKNEAFAKQHCRGTCGYTC